MRKRKENELADTLKINMGDAKIFENVFNFTFKYRERVETPRRKFTFNLSYDLWPLKDFFPNNAVILSQD